MLEQKSNPKTSDDKSNALSGLSKPDFEFILIFFFCLFRARLTAMEVPRLGVKSELYLLAYATATAMWDPSRVCDLNHSSLNPFSEARDPTCIIIDVSHIYFP